MTDSTHAVTSNDIDVRKLPPTTFGPRDTAWWATIGFMLIEGTTLVVCAASYLYLRNTQLVWPPPRTPLPSVFWPTIGVIVAVLSNLPALVMKRAAERFDDRATRKWAWVAAACSVLLVAFRWADFDALNVRWDTNAYGSIAWMVVGFHGTLVLTNLFESVVLAAILSSRHRTERHFSDTADSADYWMFLTLSWVPLYFLVYIGPNWRP
jgi:cytochrome c oxidase subunit III